MKNILRGLLKKAYYKGGTKFPKRGDLVITPSGAIRKVQKVNYTIFLTATCLIGLTVQNANNLTYQYTEDPSIIKKG